MTAPGTLTTRLALAAALLATLFVGRLWGASGRWELERALRVAALRGDVIEAHASILGARASLCGADVGETRLYLEHAGAVIGRAGSRIGDTGPIDESLRRDFAGFGAGIADAQRLAARLMRGADGASAVHGPASPATSREKP